MTTTTTYGMFIYISFITLFLLTNHSVVFISFLTPLRVYDDDAMTWDGNDNGK